MESCRSTDDDSTSQPPRPSPLSRRRRRHGCRIGIVGLAVVAAAAALVIRSVGPTAGFSPVARQLTTRRTLPGRAAPVLRAAKQEEEEAEDAPSLSSSPSEAAASASLPQKVQVCGFKDCRRVGGGKKLEALIRQVLQDPDELEGDDESAANNEVVDVEVCDCLGECGYGPNLLVDGRIVNGVRGRQAVLHALGIAASASPLPNNAAVAACPPPTTSVPVDPSAAMVTEPATQVPAPQEAGSRAQG